ncbi:MAG: peptidoglycan DD-metalloendopeptidase family protein [Hyphomicrobiaceae bacterium]|nr:peptidoglycan DD-metalloendopeptidase family protein [Hyphomicrobiaceae bacterium]
MAASLAQALVLSGLLAVVPAGPARPEPAPAATETAADRKRRTEAELDTLAREIQLGVERQSQLRTEIDTLEKDRIRLAEKMLATAGRIQKLEADIARTETRVGAIEERAGRIRDSLAARKAVLGQVLAALQRMGRKPPPAVAVRPEDALTAVRSAILLGAVLPELRAEAERLATDLGELVRLKQQAAAERDAFRADVTALVEERGRLQLLQDERKTARADQQKKLDEERQRSAELATRATSLKDLIGRLETEVDGARRAAEAARRAEEAARGREALDPKQRLAALSDPGRLQPAVEFASRRGELTRPVAGALARSFGEGDGFGGTNKGIMINTRPGAQVTSPADGWVVYSGPFRSYGQLLIINAGGGYHLVLAGMDRIDAELGQFVLAGEPVGVMGARRIASIASDGGNTQSVLYVEFRKDGVSIDPGPWWTQTQDERVRG